MTGDTILNYRLGPFINLIQNKYDFPGTLIGLSLSVVRINVCVPRTSSSHIRSHRTRLAHSSSPRRTAGASGSLEMTQGRMVNRPAPFLTPERSAARTDRSAVYTWHRPAIKASPNSFLESSTRVFVNHIHWSSRVTQSINGNTSIPRSCQRRSPR
jgi:hypothetical protein